MNELQRYIASYFQADASYLPELSGLFHQQELKKGDLHTRAGSFKSPLSFIEKGCVRIYALHDGKEITQWIASEGELVTDLGCILAKEPARWNIQALTPCTLHSLSPESYQTIGSVIPGWDRLEKQFLAKCFITLENRVFSFLSQSAEERYLRLFESRQHLFNHIPQQYLASMLGMTPETFSRIRHKRLS